MLPLSIRYLSLKIRNLLNAIVLESGVLAVDVDSGAIRTIPARKWLLDF